MKKLGKLALTLVFAAFLPNCTQTFEPPTPVGARKLTSRTVSSLIKDFQPDRTQMPNQWKFDCDMAVDGDITEIKIWVDTEFLLRIIDPRYSLNIDDTISLSNKQSVTASMQYVLANVAGPIYDNTSFKTQDSGETFVFTSTDAKFDIVKKALSDGFLIDLGTTSNAAINVVNVQVFYIPKEQPLSQPGK